MTGKHCIYIYIYTVCPNGTYTHTMSSETGGATKKLLCCKDEGSHTMNLQPINKDVTWNVKAVEFFKDL